MITWPAEKEIIWDHLTLQRTQIELIQPMLQFMLLSKDQLKTLPPNKILMIRLISMEKNKAELKQLCQIFLKINQIQTEHIPPLQVFNRQKGQRKMQMPNKPPMIRKTLLWKKEDSNQPNLFLLQKQRIQNGLIVLMSQAMLFKLQLRMFIRDLPKLLYKRPKNWVKKHLRMIHMYRLMYNIHIETLPNKEWEDLKKKVKTGQKNKLSELVYQ